MREPARRAAPSARSPACSSALYALGDVLDWPVRHKYSLPVVGDVPAASAVRRRGVRRPIANRDLPGVPLPQSDLGRLEGDDVLLMFLESYGAVTYDEPAIARVVAPARDELAHAAAETGRHVVSAYASSPTFGGGSWLAHASFMSGVEVRDTGDYMLLLTQERETWPKLFEAAGYRAIAVMPGMRSAWPEGAFYGFDAIYDELALDYRGPDFGWWRIPDQFSLARVARARGAQRFARAAADVSCRRSTRTFRSCPCRRIRPTGSACSRPSRIRRRTSKRASPQTPDWEALGGPYADSFVYTFTYLAGYLARRAPRPTRRWC